jgi:thiamine pyrophosphate-dependent acetolactate synthase large subunit-like protein
VTGPTVAAAVGAALVRAGIGHVFGVVGSGNFDVTTAMVAAGARFVAARHETGAATMADAFTRMSPDPAGGVAAVSLHQGCGLTNALTGITEAAKSRTPLVVVTAEATAPRSNFFVDQPALAAAVGAVSTRITSAEEAPRQAAEAVATAVGERRTVLLNLPLDVQSLPAARTVVPASMVRPLPPGSPEPDPVEVERLAGALRAARRPVFVAGRGARGPGCRAALERLADRCGALLATSAVAKGLFAGNPWSLDVSGGFASPLAADLIGGADLIVGWGATLNMWTMRHGRLIAPGATVVQVDLDPDAVGAHRQLSFGVVGDVLQVAEAVLDEMPATEVAAQPGYRSPEVRAELATAVRWRDTPFETVLEPGRIDPRELTVALDRLLPEERIVSVDSGNFMGYPSMFLGVPDEFGFCFTQAFQCVGLGLATAIGAALARPDRLPVAALGDGGLLMGAAELETVVRLGLPMVVVVYDDAAYGAEVHHFGPGGAPLDTVRFPERDLAAIARGYGFDGLTVRAVEDLRPVASWLDGPRTAPLLIDAKVTRDEPSWWLEEAFRGH